MILVKCNVLNEHTANTYVELVGGLKAPAKELQGQGIAMCSQRLENGDWKRGTGHISRSHHAKAMRKPCVNQAQPDPASWAGQSSQPERARVDNFANRHMRGPTQSVCSSGNAG